MVSLHATNVFNVEATLNQWLRTQVAAITRPSWLPAVTVVFNMPEAQLPTPAISVFHIPVSTSKAWQGDNTGGRKGGRSVALMDISCWVSRGAGSSWNAQLIALKSMVTQIFAGTGQVVISDYLSNPSSPSAVTYKIDLGELDAQNVQADPNPDIERVRFLLRYEWTVRA